jgi:hypothetical protein
MSGLFRLNIKVRRLAASPGELGDYYGRVLDEFDRQRRTLD